MEGATRLAMLTGNAFVGIIANMKAELVYRSKTVLSDGAIVEMVIWRLPTPVLKSEHVLKYRLFYGKDGKRLVAFDNERGKGDHMHLGDREFPYVFVSVEKLMNDFLFEVRKLRSGQ